MLDESKNERMKCKIDLCYLMAKEDMTFKKYAALYKLEAHYAYKTALSANLFTHYIAESQRQQLFQALSETKFCSFHMDGSTKAGNVELHTNSFVCSWWMPRKPKHPAIKSLFICYVSTPDQFAFIKQHSTYVMSLDRLTDRFTAFLTAPVKGGGALLLSWICSLMQGFHTLQ